MYMHTCIQAYKHIYTPGSCKALQSVILIKAHA